MTKKDYDRTRVMPERVAASDRGKELVKELAETIRARIAVEYPEDIAAFDEHGGDWWHSLYFYFAKYMLANTTDSATGRPSAIFVLHVESDGERRCSCNLFDNGDPDVEVVEWDILNALADGLDYTKEGNE